VRITHPFHPLCGREYHLVEYRWGWGREYAVFCGENGERIAVPVAWTDLAEGTDPFVTLSEGRAFASPADLLALQALIEEVKSARFDVRQRVKQRDRSVKEIMP
jgi:hypothetical protein